jgi:hypothetical protein
MPVLDAAAADSFSPVDNSDGDYVMPTYNAAAVDSFYLVDTAEGNGGIKFAFYGTLNEASNFFDQRLYNRPWKKSNRRQQEAALAEATQLIDNLNYWGCKTDEDQSNSFPRNGSTIVPIDVRRATYEIALKLLDGYDVEKEIQGLAIVGEGYSSARIQYDRAAPQEHIRNGIPSFRAWQLLVVYLADPHSISMVRVN